MLIPHLWLLPVQVLVQPQIIKTDSLVLTTLKTDGNPVMAAVQNPALTALTTPIQTTALQVAPLLLFFLPSLMLFPYTRRRFGVRSFLTVGMGGVPNAALNVSNVSNVPLLPRLRTQTVHFWQPLMAIEHRARAGPCLPFFWHHQERSMTEELRVVFNLCERRLKPTDSEWLRTSLSPSVESNGKMLNVKTN